MYKISHGYYVRIPRQSVVHMGGELLEGKGVQPDCTVPNGLTASRDSQLDRAVDIVGPGERSGAAGQPILFLPQSLLQNTVDRRGLEEFLGHPLLQAKREYIAATSALLKTSQAFNACTMKCHSGTRDHRRAAFRSNYRPRRAYESFVS